MTSRSRFVVRSLRRTMSTLNSSPPKPNALPPQNWKASAPGPPVGCTIARAQASLPRLPVPALEDTFARLRRSLSPLAHNKDELKEVERKIRAFESGPAATLQARLLDRQKTTEHWLEEWWDSGAYMGYRDSVVVNVSYFYGFVPPPAQERRGPAYRAASIARSVALFRQQYRNGTLAPEATRDGPICMDTYRWMFDCCRVPGGKGLDWQVTHARPEDRGTTGHIVVLRRNRFWRVELARNGVLLSTEDLERQFRYIYEHTTRDYPAVGTLTASNRDVWATDYAELLTDPTNANILNTIHSSAFIVCLDEANPSGIDAFSRQLWHGGQSGRWLANRWVDKPVQVVVCDGDGDGALAGAMCEHSVMDGMPTQRMFNDVLTALAAPTFDHGAPSQELPPPEPLDFHVSSKTSAAIEAAVNAAQELTDGQVLRVFESKYGKRTAKRVGVSPDAWAQMLIQLAYTRLLASRGQKREGATYEAATTRRFHKGRTETVRSITTESEAWVRAMGSAEESDESRRELFRAAAKRHIQLAKEAGNAQGVDRHMLGLRKLVSEGEEVPELYSDPLYVRSARWVLSTSALYSPHFNAYGWGEVVPDGFGVAYMTGFDDKLFFNITARKEMPMNEFFQEMDRAARDMYTLFATEATGETKAKL